MTESVIIVTGGEMPRGFTEQEKKNIHNRLLNSGREAFGLYGIRKTSVDELVNRVGISKGAFYQFFESKEDLYFAILRDMETKQQAGIYQLLSQAEANQQELLKQVLLDMMRQVEGDPFMRRLLTGEEYGYLAQKFTPEQLQEAMTADVDFAGSLIALWKERGKLKVDDPELIAGTLRGIFFLFLHKEDIGENVFPRVVELLLDASIKELIEE